MLIYRLIRLLYYLPMERMKHTGDYELDEINMLEQECADLEEENKTLKDNVEFLHSCLDDRDKSIAIMQEENKKLREELKETQETLEHRDGFFSIMRDVLANDNNDDYDIATILYNVVHSECWADEDFNKLQREVVRKFWNREYC